MRILITGAAGRLGRYLRERLPRSYYDLRLLDVAPIAEPAGDAGDAGDDVVLASITDLDALTAAAQDMDAIVHLAGIATEAGWRDLLEVNIDGTRNVLEAARANGIDRVVLASSNHAAGYHLRAAEPLPADLPPRPDTYYGVSKAALEALGSLYADRFGMSVASLRIGTCADRPQDARALATWLSPDDFVRLVEACLRAPAFGHRTLWGVSANTRRWWSLVEGEALGYRPETDSEAYADGIGAPGDYDDLVGGPFVAMPLGVFRRG
jgi:NADP-dependent aldehyde dehydrogenase